MSFREDIVESEYGFESSNAYRGNFDSQFGLRQGVSESKIDASVILCPCVIKFVP